VTLETVGVLGVATLCSVDRLVEGGRSPGVKHGEAL
jgi:hypothetical protein